MGSTPAGGYKIKVDVSITMPDGRCVDLHDVELRVDSIGWSYLCDSPTFQETLE